MQASHRNRIAWAAVTLLTVLCGLMGILQHRWIGEISQAERERLQNELDNKLDLIRSSFNDPFEGIHALFPPLWQVERVGIENAYAEQFQRWRDLHGPLFKRMSVAVWRDGSLRFLDWDSKQGVLHEAAWPVEWMAARDQIAAGQRPPYDTRRSQFIDIPRFGPAPQQLTFEHPAEDLLLELNLNYVRGTLLPELFRRYMSEGGKSNYDAQVYVANNPGTVIFQSGNPREVLIAADATTSLFELPSPPDLRSGAALQGPGGQPSAARESGRWVLAARHRAGSLETIVERARVRNLVISSSLLLLIIATAFLLVRLSLERERLAGLQMSFVTGVSHELRTPLSVIRTAAFNLRGKISQRPEQVESYGKLIQNETEKLTDLVERVLLFARMKSGETGRPPQPVTVTELVERAVVAAASGCHPAPPIDVKFEPGLSDILADGEAVRMALRNIVENAIKYAAPENPWVGVTCSSVRDRHGDWVEVRVADRGPGIPDHEQSRIFDAFFRGDFAMRRQIHGTGLGLNLAKSAIESNHGTIRVVSAKSQGTEFIVRFPAMAPEPDEAPSAATIQT